LKAEKRGPSLGHPAARGRAFVGAAIGRFDALTALARTLAIAKTAVAIAAPLARHLVLATQVAVWAVRPQRIPVSAARCLPVGPPRGRAPLIGDPVAPFAALAGSLVWPRRQVPLSATFRYPNPPRPRASLPGALSSCS